MNQSFLKKLTFALSLSLITFSFSWSTDRVYPTQYASIQSAIDNAVAGDNIIINSNFTGTFTVNKSNLRIYCNYYSLNLTSQIIVGSSGTKMYDGNFYGANYQHAIRTEASSSLELWRCNLYGVWMGNSAYAIDDYGARSIIIVDCYMNQFSECIDAVNNIYVYGENSTFSSKNTALYFYTNISDDINYYGFYSNSIVSQYADGVRVNKANGPYSSNLMVDYSELFVRYNGYPIAGSGTDCSVGISNNYFSSCPYSSYILENGASLEYSSNNTYGACQP